MGSPGAEVQVVPGRGQAPQPASTCSLILGKSPFFLCLGFLTCGDMNTFQRVTLYTGAMASFLPVPRAFDAPCDISLGAESVLPLWVPAALTLGLSVSLGQNPP